MTSAPKRAMSKRLAATAISSMAQQARPIGIGHIELVRIQLMTASSRETMTSPSILLSEQRAEALLELVDGFECRLLAEDGGEPQALRGIEAVAARA
jgi:hypothetical protein